MTLVPQDHLLWDFWFAPRRAKDEPYHLFYLKAPRSLTDPDDRHAMARVGHAVSDDLVDWTLLPEALGPGEPGAWDDRAIWTGSVIWHDGQYVWFYTGTNTGENGQTQRIGLATSPDLTTWTRHPGNPVVAADRRWYRVADGEPYSRSDCRDPWVMPDPDGIGWVMFFTAIGVEGPEDERGVIGMARSENLVDWTVHEPVAAPGEFGEIEVPQPVTINGTHYLLFCTAQHAKSRIERRGSAAAWMGSDLLVGDGLLGPFRVRDDRPLAADTAWSYYAGRFVEGPDGQPRFLAFRNRADDGSFVGGLSNPAPLKFDDGNPWIDFADLWD